MDGPTIGILSPLTTGWYYGSLISAVNQSVSAAGGRVVAISTSTFGTGQHREQVSERLPHFGWGRIDGFITIAGAVPLEYLEDLSAAGKPVVAMAHEEPGFECPTVLADNHGPVRQAVGHLVKHGHTRIAFVGGTEFDSRERYAAYCEALRAHGIEPDPSLYYASADSHEFAGREAGERMVAAGLPSTAVVVASDLTAIGVMAALKAAGYLLPADQAVIGFDDLSSNITVTPALSSISQHLDEMALVATKLVLKLASGEAVPAGRHIVEGSLVPRESCGCASKPVAEAPGHGEKGQDLVAAFSEAFAKAAGQRTGGAVTSTPAERVKLLASVIEATFHQAALQDVTPPELVQLSLAARELYLIGRNEPTSDAILGFAREVSAKLSRQPGGATSGVNGPAAARRLDACVAEVQLGLAKALVSERNEAFYDLRKAVRDEHDISLDLLRSHESDPRRLGWLSRTNVLAGVLATWKDKPSTGATNRAKRELDLSVRAGAPVPSDRPSRVGATAGTPAELEIVGTYQAGSAVALPSAGSYCPEDFPPPELVEPAGPGTVVVLFPVTSDERDWGVLAVLVPLGTGFLGQDTFFQWKALLTEALDYQDVLQSLRERSRQLHERGEQLALSYRREREMAEAVRESEERYALAARAANDGLWDWDLDRGTMYYSARWREMLGYSGTAIGNTPEEWLDRVHPEDKASLLSDLTALRLGEQAFILNEHRARTRDGGYIWALCRGLAVPGVGKPATRIVGSLTDVTERHLLEERLRQQALYDPLTGLPNRVLFLDRLSQAIARNKRGPASTYAVLWLDLDGFKIINDSLGHQMGDKLLVQVAERIHAQLRGSDTAARFGGDEFAVLLVDIADAVTVKGVAQRLLEHLGAPYDLDGNEIVVTASLGVAMSTSGCDRPEDILRDADIAMYRAKSSGRGAYAIFDSSMHASAMARLLTETELRQAIQPRGEAPSQMELHYQPVVDLASGEVTGLEALVRWRHPRRGLVTPMEFLQVAEDSGLIVPMGRWVAAQACRQLASWHSAGVLSRNVRVSLNLSNREFWSPRLLEGLDTVLKESGVSPDRLAFEITEGVVIDNLQRALVVLHELHARGLEVHVDDFGTGYSSLQALHRLPIDALKIDKSFVAGLGQDDRTAELLRTIVQLGRNLGVTVIAEGVETPGQRNCLRDLGCACGQGYLFSPPVTAAGFEKLVAADHFRPVPPDRLNAAS